MDPISIYLSIYLSIQVSIHLSFYQSIHQPINPPISRAHFRRGDGTAPLEWIPSLSIYLSICSQPQADPHSHVLDCSHAPEDMLGHGLFLAEDNGGPHVAPNPARKFERHWLFRKAAGVREVLRRLAAEEAAMLPKEFRDLARMGCGYIHSFMYVFMYLFRLTVSH